MSSSSEPLLRGSSENCTIVKMIIATSNAIRGVLDEGPVSRRVAQTRHHCGDIFVAQKPNHSASS